MNTESVTDPLDPRVAAFRLNERGLNPRSVRREATPPGLFVAEGDLVVERALDAGCHVRTLLASPRFVDAAAAPASPWRDEERLHRLGNVPVLVADDDVRRNITGLGVPLDVVGLFERPPTPDVSALLATARRVVVIVEVDNPTNIGAIVRSATALGADALLLDRTSADPLTRRALRVSMGAALVLPTARVDDAATAIRSLHGAGIETVALTPDGSAPSIHTLAPGPRVALFLGAERSGLDAGVMSECNHCCRIPMAHGVDSLNVAAAAAVACFALFRPA